MSSYKLTFTKRDILFHNFFSIEDSLLPLPISYYVELAVSHYALTGEYLPIGTVTVDEPKEYFAVKALYFKKGGIAENYLNEQKMLGMAYSATIKLILEQCLVIGDENKLMTKAEYLIQRQKINSYLLNGGEKPSLGLYDYAHKKDSRAVAAGREIPAEKKLEKIDKVPEKTRQKANRPSKSDLSFADNFVFGDIE